MSWRKDQKINYSYEKYPLNTRANTKPVKSSWSTNKKLKEDIKNHYSIVQNDTCAYCRLPILRFDGYGEPIEHIVPKSLKVKWMFHPLNLCLSCYGCNTKKSDQDTLINQATHIDNFNNYPNSSTDFKIIHPHFDVFSKHIHEENLIYKPKDDSIKGRNTIDFCELNRLDVLYAKARIKRISNKVIVNKLTSVALDYRISPEERKSAIEMINRLIERYDYHKALIIANS